MSKAEIKNCTDPERIAHHLVFGIDDENDQLERIFQWVVDHIHYDSKALSQDSQRINKNLSDVLKRKKALCVGYAQLLGEMCRTVGIPAVEVSGYARDRKKVRTSFKRPDHSWNAIFVDGRWQLIDATWAKTTEELNSSDQIFRADNYFLTSPEEFLLDHIPANPIWQLIKCPLPIESFYLSTEELKSVLTLQNECDDTDQIQQYMELDKMEQIYESHKMSYQYHPTSDNRKSFAGSLIDRALEIKDEGDEFFFSNQYTEAQNRYDKALADLSQEIIQDYQMYDWQKEGVALIYFHRAQIQYNQISSKQDEDYESKINLVLSDLKNAQWYVSDVKVNLMNQAFIDQIDRMIDLVSEE